MPIFPAFCVWSKARRYTATLCDPIEVTGSDPVEAEREATVRLARVFEDFISRHLLYWFNFTPLWPDGVEAKP